MKINIISILVACLLIVACNSDEKPFIKGGDAITSTILSEGLQANPSISTINLKFRHLPGIMTATCNLSWIKVVSVSTDESLTSTDLQLLVDRNPHIQSRHATLTLTVDGFTTHMNIEQMAEDMMIPQDEVIYAVREGGDVGVMLETNIKGNIRVDIRCEGQSDWIEYVDSVYAYINPWEPDNIPHVTTGQPECFLHFKTKTNSGFGRICKVTVSAEGSDVKSDFCIIQQPRLFEEKETISIEHAGTLDVLIGTDKKNLCRVRNITLSGEMNGVDWTALNMLLNIGSYMDSRPLDYSVDIDMGMVNMKKGDQSFYSFLGYKPKEAMYHVEADNEIPNNALESSKFLREIILPVNTVKICDHAFSHTNLSRIDIPDAVEDIGRGAFSDCQYMKIVNISDNSHLRKLGTDAFNSYGTIEYINLPLSLTEIEYGCLNIYVKVMKVHWQTPPVLEFPPFVKDDGILYVPKGTAKLYESAYGWNSFPSILEYEEYE